MAFSFTVEDGTGLEASNAYISVSYADDYFEGVSDSTWSDASTSEKEDGIVKATRYLETRFFDRWRGIIADSDQALAWPRDYVYDERGVKIEEVPERVKKACAEYALRALSSALLPDPGHDAAGIVKSKSESVGPISQEIEYQSTRAMPAYPAADQLLRPLLHGPGVVRA